MSKFIDHYAKCIRYEAGHEDVTNLLSQLSSPEHNHTRWGTAQGDRTFRGVVSDALRDNNRNEEADVLDEGGHVVVHEGKVKRGRFTLGPLYQFRDRLATEIRNRGGWDEAHPPMGAWDRGPQMFLPEAGWVTSNPHDDGVDEPYVFDLSRHRLSKTGLPVVEGSTFTCHDYRCGIDKVPKKWTRLLTETLFHPRNDVLNHLDQPTREELEALANEGHKLQLEEPVPEPK